MNKFIGKPAVPFVIPALLILASSVSILSTDLYTPSLPHLQSVFSASAGQVQLTITLNLAAFGIAQLGYGPLSDRIGRRPVLLGGMVGFAVASMMCMAANSIEALIIARMLQGLTGCVEVVVAYAIIRELYDEAAAVRIYAAYGMTIALAPAIGPIIGGHMHIWFGWKSNFLLLTGLIITVVFLIWRYLPETLKHGDPNALHPRRLISEYTRLLTTPLFMTYSLIMSLLMGGLFAMLTAFPFLFIEHMGTQTEHYGYYFGTIILSFFLGSMIANRLANRISSDPLLAIGLCFCAIGGLSIIFIVANHQGSPLTITATQCFSGIGLGLVFATAPVRAFDVSNTGHGYTAALLGALPMAGGAIGSLCISVSNNENPWAIAIVLTVTNLSATGLYLVVRPWRKIQ